MFTDAYTKLNPENCHELIEQLNSLVDGSAFTPNTLRILSHDLPFYQDYALFEVADLSVTPERIIHFIARRDFKNDKLYILNGTNEAIYALNESAPISLSDETVVTYILFFFSYVRGRFGQFKIVQHIDDIIWREEPSTAGKKALSKMIEPVAIKDKNDQSYILSSNIVFKDTLFESDIVVAHDGKINLSNQEMLVEDIPVVDS